MKILTGHEAQPEGDGVTVVVRKLAHEALAYGDTDIVVTGWAQHPELSPVPIVTVKAIRFPLYREYRMPYQWRFDAETEKKLDAYDADVIHLHSPGPFFAHAIITYARKKSIPIVVTHHTDFIRYLRYYHISALKPVAWWLLRSVYNKADVVTTPSTATAQDLIDNGIHHVRVLPWGTELDVFNPSKQSNAWRDSILHGRDGKILMCACRLTWEKDLKTLAKTWNIIRQKHSDVAMVIAGDGPNRKDLEKLMPGAQFLGRLTKEDLAVAYASSDILLFPSSTETFGNVTIEAMASGIAPVVANEGGSKTLVKNGETGLLCRTRDAQDFVQKVEKLLGDENLLLDMKKRAIAYAQQYSWSNVYDRIHQLYETVQEEASEEIDEKDMSPQFEK